MTKTKVCVLFGGVSKEYEISLITASSIIKKLSKEKYEVIPIGITKSGHWLYYPGNVDKIENDTYSDDLDCTPAIISPDRTHHGILKLELNGKYSILKIDCVFCALHGNNGEDGTIQGLCELANIPYVGCGVGSSANCMDKIICHTILDAHGIKGTDWTAVYKEDLSYIDKKSDEIIDKLSLPIFVKPANSGSSVGISKSHSKEDLIRAIKLAFSHDKKVICEKTIEGREIECAVLGNENPKASILGEILPCNEFYDYNAKYKCDPKLVIPAKLDEKTAAKVRDIAVKAFKVMGCAGLSRVDFLINNQGIYLNEINTMPGFTSISMYPKLWEKSGLLYANLLDELIQLAITQQNNKIF